MQAVGFDIPPGAPQHLVACRRQRSEVRHVAAGHEADAGARRQAEQLDQPRAGDSSMTDAAGDSTYRLAG